MSQPHTIRFLFDYLSPYAYVAWPQVRALCARRGCRVEPTPVLLAGLLNAGGQKGPAEIPAKRVYVLKDAMRLAHHVKLPLLPPPSHPFNPLLALRVSALPMPEETRIALVTALFDATWGGGPGVTEPEVVAQIMARIGLDGPSMIAQAQSDDGKKRLKQLTHDAIAAGAFGVPTMLIGRELFWGNDSLPHLERYLDGNDPITPELLSTWAKVRPSASRS